MTASVFYGFNAYVGVVEGQYRCRWWPDDPSNLNWDLKKVIPVDLSLTPEAARQGTIKIDQVIVDDFLGLKLGGRTTIGPDFPYGKMTGGCYLEASYYDSLPSKPSRIPPGFQCREYELTSLYYWDGPLQGRRYHGFHAEIKASNASGSHAMVSIYPAGRSLVPNITPAGTFWLDLTRTAHPIDRSCTEIGTAAGAPRVGALFLEQNTVRVLSLDVSKHPVVMGSDLLF